MLILVQAFPFRFESLKKVITFLSETNDVRFAEDEGRFLVGDDRSSFSCKSDVLRPVMLQQQVVGGLAGFHYVTRNHHRHVGQAAHGKQIFEGLMGGAVPPRRPHGHRRSSR